MPISVRPELIIYNYNLNFLCETVFLNAVKNKDKVEKHTWIALDLSI